MLSKLQDKIPNKVLTELQQLVEKHSSINTPLRLSHFLSQCAHESGNFKFTEENLKYSKDGLKKVFGKYFPDTLNEAYAGKPQMIASRVYANRMGNGDEKSSDGWKYRGRGYIQLTGKSNYLKFSKFIGEDVVANPDLVSTKYSMLSAYFFFESNKLWSICDKGSSVSVITELTKRINGGYNGLQDRISKFNTYFNLIK